MLDIIAKYEDLRLAVPERMKDRLRQPGKEYSLIERDGEQLLVPVEYSEWAVCPQPTDETSDTIHLGNRWQEGAKLGLDIECGEVFQAGESYKNAQTLELFEAELPGSNTSIDTSLYDPAIHGHRATKRGVTQKVSLITDDVKEGKGACRFEATSSRSDRGGWATFGKEFDPPLALKGYKAIALWVKGDGNGEQLKVQLRDDKHAEDHYIKIDFKDWQLLELPRPERSRVDYSRITHLNFYYNGMPGNKTVCCLIDGVKVVSESVSLAYPVLKVGDTRIVFPVHMSTKGRIAYRGPDNCWFYPNSGHRQKIVLKEELGDLRSSLKIEALPTTYQLRFRAAVFWPSLGTVLRQ